MSTGKCCTTLRGEDSVLRVSAQAQSCTRVSSLSRVMHPRPPPTLPAPLSDTTKSMLISCTPSTLGIMMLNWHSANANILFIARRGRRN